jgi:hypothetical protein
VITYFGYAIEYRAVDGVGGTGVVAMERCPNQFARIAIVFPVISFHWEIKGLRIMTIGFQKRVKTSLSCLWW